MPLLDVPYLPQREPGGCLVACAAMVLAHLEQPALQEEIARQLGARSAGVPASNIRRLAAWGLDVQFTQGFLNELAGALVKGHAPIIFLRTSELPYWHEDTPHAVVLVDLDLESAWILDPAFEDETPVRVGLGDFLLAWSYFDMMYALITR